MVRIKPLLPTPRVSRDGPSIRIVDRESAPFSTKGGLAVFADLRKLSLSFGTATALASLAPSLALAGPPPSASAVSVSDSHADPGGEVHANTCLAQTVCSVKEKIRWQTPAWTPSQCGRIADAVATSAKRHDLSPTLLLAIMVNESDMNEKAARIYTREGKVYAKDGGLMAIRCLLDEHDRCTNGNVRGVAWKDLMDPVTNIELGARELAHWRDGGGVDEQDHRQARCRPSPPARRQRKSPVITRPTPGGRTTTTGPATSTRDTRGTIPHRIAVLDHAFATVMNTPAPELDSRTDHHPR